ncbi:MAG: acyl-CoA synthetase [Pseudomonadales bacterium]|nr:acyl-CoA synthetase [Pseudomonadales bacterium]
MTSSWNLGDIFDALAEAVPRDRTALIHGDREVSWQQFTARSNNLARNLLDNGAKIGDKIAFYLRNCPEYTEGMVAGFKARLSHVNVNYRYIENELIYLLDNSDATVCIFSAEFAEQVSKIRDKLPKVKQWVQVEDGTLGLKDVIAYEDFASKGNGQALSDMNREPSDQLFIYTGGTTGLPKGVMWSHDALWNVLGAGGNPRMGIPPCEDLTEHLGRVTNNPMPTVALPLPPLMHGTGLLSALMAMGSGGTCITLTSRNFEANLALAEIDKHKVTTVSIVGDAFARPLVEALDNNYLGDFSSVLAITSSGVMWTREVKEGLLRHNENLILLDGFSSSEAIGLGSSIMTKDESIDVAKFTLGPACKVFKDDGTEVIAGSGEKGMVAVSGFLPDGYYKDQAKTDSTFKVFDGTRYSIPGDYVEVLADGSLVLLGRGSNCINTAGEKVFPEEVEEALKRHESISDCLVVGLADEKWGQSITAVVEVLEGHTMSEAELRQFSREHLAAYKIPKRILIKDDLERAANGKANYKLIKEFAEAALS